MGKKWYEKLDLEEALRISEMVGYIPGCDYAQLDVNCLGFDVTVMIRGPNPEPQLVEYYMNRLMVYILAINDEEDPLKEGIKNSLITKEVLDWYKKASKLQEERQ
jgi:hypothetical protein